MINIFNELFTLLDASLTALEMDIETSSVYTNMPSHYPFVSLEEIDNRVYEETSNCNVENHAEVDYEVNIYTQEPNKKTNADKIAEAVDTLFASLGFVRQTKNSMQSSDETTYRIIIRYIGIVSQNHKIYRR